jgi:hypothetical protein
MLEEHWIGHAPFMVEMIGEMMGETGARATGIWQKFGMVQRCES